MADPVLSAALSGQRKILLTWTFDSNADFQVFWKSSSPPGQEYVLLATTNAFSYTTPDLEPSLTYDFYVRANVGQAYYYSNVVQLFISCGQGVILSSDPPDPPPAQVFKRNVYAALSSDTCYVQGVENGNFQPMGLTFRGYVSICVDTNDNVYVATSGAGLYLITGGVGDAIYLADSPDNSLQTVVVALNGDIYLAKAFGPIWRKAGGVGAWVNLAQPAYQWYGLAAGKSGHIYCAVYSFVSGQGGIWKRTNGVGNFQLIWNSPGKWTAVTVAPNGDVYACVDNGDIWMETAETGNFVALGQVSRRWRGLAATPGGHIYASVYGGYIYKRAFGAGDFQPVFSTATFWWQGMGARIT